MNSFDHYIAKIKNKLPDAEVKFIDMKGTGDHLKVHVTSNHFVGMTLLAQHRMITDVLKEELQSEIHALVIKTSKFE